MPKSPKIRCGYSENWGGRWIGCKQPATHRVKVTDPWGNRTERLNNRCPEHSRIEPGPLGEVYRTYRFRTV